jgi:hypothetical protein
MRVETRAESDEMRDEMRDEIPGDGAPGNLRVHLIDASDGNIDYAADVSPRPTGPTEPYALAARAHQAAKPKMIDAVTGAKVVYGFLSRAHLEHALAGDLRVAARAADLDARITVQANTLPDIGSPISAKVGMSSAAARRASAWKGRRARWFGDLRCDSDLRMAYGAIHGVLRAGKAPTGITATSFIDAISTTETLSDCALAT